jgi:SAM-dependent methyltransferase
VNAPLEGLSEEGLWQVVEFAGYTADLPLWEELAGRGRGSVLDLGCGVGRVAHHLANRGSAVTGVDLDPGLVDDFNSIARGLELPAGASSRAVEADASDIGNPSGPLAGRTFDLVIAPQQFVQLLDAERRLTLFRGIHRLLAPEGLAAFAICEDLPQESIHFPGVLPDSREDGGWYYSSLPVAIEPSADWITSWRRRERVSPDGEIERSDDEVRIHRLHRKDLERELGEGGFGPLRIVEIPQTERHMGSTAVIARPEPPARPAAA